MDSEAGQIAESLGVLLQRRFRSGLYATLTEGVHEALDAAAYPVLSGVARLGPVSAASLGIQIGLDRSVVSRRAAALVTAGLLTTATDPADARATLICLTSDGQKVVRTLRSRLVAAIDAHLTDWSPRQRREFAALLARFVEPGEL